MNTMSLSPHYLAELTPESQIDYFEKKFLEILEKNKTESYVNRIVEDEIVYLEEAREEAKELRKALKKQFNDKKNLLSGEKKQQITQALEELDALIGQLSDSKQYVSEGFQEAQQHWVEVSSAVTVADFETYDGGLYHYEIKGMSQLFTEDVLKGVLNEQGEVIKDVNGDQIKNIEDVWAAQQEDVELTNPIFFETEAQFQFVGKEGNTLKLLVKAKDGYNEIVITNFKASTLHFTRLEQIPTEHLQELTSLLDEESLMHIFIGEKSLHDLLIKEQMVETEKLGYIKGYATIKEDTTFNEALSLINTSQLSADQLKEMTDEMLDDIYQELNQSATTGDFVEFWNQQLQKRQDLSDQAWAQIMTVITYSLAQHNFEALNLVIAPIVGTAEGFLAQELNKKSKALILFLESQTGGVGQYGGAMQVFETVLSNGREPGQWEDSTDNLAALTLLENIMQQIGRGTPFEIQQARDNEEAFIDYQQEQAQYTLEQEQFEAEQLAAAQDADSASWSSGLPGYVNDSVDYTVNGWKKGVENGGLVGGVVGTVGGAYVGVHKDILVDPIVSGGKKIWTGIKSWF